MATPEIYINTTETKETSTILIPVEGTSVDSAASGSNGVTIAVITVPSDGKGLLKFNISKIQVQGSVVVYKVSAAGSRSNTIYTYAQVGAGRVELSPGRYEIVCFANGGVTNLNTMLFTVSAPTLGPVYFNVPDGKSIDSIYFNIPD